MTALARRRRYFWPAVLALLAGVLATGAFFPRVQPVERIAAFVMKWGGTR